MVVCQQRLLLHHLLRGQQIWQWLHHRIFSNIIIIVIYGRQQFEPDSPKANSDLGLVVRRCSKHAPRYSLQKSHGRIRVLSEFMTKNLSVYVKLLGRTSFRIHHPIIHVGFRIGGRKNRTIIWVGQPIAQLCGEL